MLLLLQSRAQQQSYYQLIFSHSAEMKESWKPGTMVYPAPAVLVSCGTAEHSNLVTVAWTGTLCTNPALAYISLRPERYSYNLVRDTMEFTINLTTEQMARAVDWCGVKSGRDFDKWAETGLTPVPGKLVRCPSIEQSPLSIECRVREIVDLGSHHMFIGEVLDLLADSEYINPQTGAFELERSGLMAYSHGHYFSLGRELGHFGWSVRKK